MRRLALVLLASAGCGAEPDAKEPALANRQAQASAPSAREQDCAQAREILERGRALPPRRYREVGIHDVPYRQLKQLAYRDPDVKQAMLALVNANELAAYTPDEVQFVDERRAKDEAVDAAFARANQMCRFESPAARRAATP